MASTHGEEQKAELSDLNFVLNAFISDITSVFRCRDSFGFHADSFLKEMIQIPRLKYLCSSRTPFYSEGGEPDKGESSEDDVLILTKRLFAAERMCISNGRERGKGVKSAHLSTLIAYRGMDMQSHGEKREVVKRVQAEDTKRTFLRDIVCTVMKEKQLEIAQSACMIANSSVIAKPIRRNIAAFSKLFQRMAFMHWFQGEGMKYYEFQEADKYARDLCVEYEQYDNTADLE